MRKITLSLAVVLATACSEPRKQVDISDALPTILLPPSSQIIGKEAGEDAIKVKFRSSWAPEALAAYYRDQLAQRPWRLVSDVKTADGSFVLYAETDGPPLWVSIRRADGSAGSFVDLAGAKTR
ncbi:MAG: hypothetical protein OEW17_01320 [Gemmatimonadota bacterium]|nr:hypothetical protein [Gemmatimonadota bacterium]MDH4347422.1 hypothetical protein [Gemmatimonadota bacterium]MDH5282885.1 hypothetical protein [Gemmatimonadota bacterium]